MLTAPWLRVRVRVPLSGCSLGPHTWVQFRSDWSYILHLESFSLWIWFCPDFIPRMFALCTQSSVRFIQYLFSASILFFLIPAFAFPANFNSLCFPLFLTVQFLSKVTLSSNLPFISLCVPSADP